MALESLTNRLNAIGGSRSQPSSATPAKRFKSISDSLKAPVTRIPQASNLQRRLSIITQEPPKPKGFVRTVTPLLIEKGSEAFGQYLESEEEKRAGMTLGQKFKYDIIRKPGGIIRFLAQGAASIPLAIGRSMQEAAGFETGSKTETTQRWEEKIFGQQVETYQEITRSLQEMIDFNPESTEREKQFLAPLLGVALFASDAFPGKPSGKKQAIKLFREIAEETSEKAIRKNLIKSGINKEIAGNLAVKLVDVKDANAVRETMRREAGEVVARLIDETPARPARQTEATPARAADVEPEQSARAADLPPVETKTPEPSPQVAKLEKRLEDGAESFYRSAENGRRFDRINEEDVLPAFIKEDLDTFVVKTDGGFDVIEGQTGQQLGTTGETVAAAIKSAKEEIAGIGDEALAKAIDDAPISPRYTQPEALKDVPRVEGVEVADKVFDEKAARRRSLKLVTMAKKSPSVEKFVENSGLTKAALDKTVQKQGFKNVEDFFDKNGPGKVSRAEAKKIERPDTPEEPKPDLDKDTELQSFEILAEQQEGSEFATHIRKEEAEEVTDNLRQIFAEMQDIDLNDPKLKFSEEDLFKAQQEYEFMMDALMDDPARALSKYANRNGELPEVTGTEFVMSKTGANRRIKNSTFGRRGDDIASELGFESSEAAREAFTKYTKRREAVQEVLTNLRNVREGIRLAKQMDQFVGQQQKALARELATNRRALSKLVQAAEKAGFRKGFKTGQKKYQTLVNRLRDRRQRFAGLKWAYNLTDGELRKIQGDVDPRFMSKVEFEDYIADLDIKARDIEARRIERGIVKAVIQEKNLKNTENLRQAMDLPPLSEMNLKELARYEKQLAKLEDFDEILSKRTLEVIDRTALKGARTVRQVRNFLALELKRTQGKDVKVTDLENLVADNFDPYLYDAALADKQPFYSFMVHRTHKHMLEGEANFLRLQNRFEDLVRKANKSRKRSLKEKVKQKFIPTKPEIIRFLEARGEEKKLFAKALTKEEMELATFMRNYYNNAYNYLSYINELQGSRYIDAYFTHVRKGFLEKWNDDGFIAAMKNVWDQQKEDMAIANIIDKDTGEILPKSKFFQYTLRRTGEGEVSQNATRVFLQYARIFERKKMLDKMVPEIDIYTRSLTPKEMTPRGLEMNRKMRGFVNEYLNNKRGRRAKYMYVAQNSIPDMMLRGGNTMVSLLDLGLNFMAGTAALVGEQMANYALLGAKGTLLGFKRRLWDTGIKRFSDPKAKQILKDNEAFVGRNIWTELAEVDQTPLDQGMKGMFGLFSQSTVEANKIYFLANLTKKELKSGKISAERLAELRLDAARWRDMGRDVKSIVGSTSPGQVFTKYKSWAIPILTTTAKNYKRTAGRIRRGEIKDLATSRELKEIIRQAETVAVALYVGAIIAGHDDDDGFIAKLKARVQQEALTLVGGLDPRFFLASPRLVSWLTTLADNLFELATMEEYKTDSKYGDKGDLKGLGGLKQQFTPGVIRQFLPDNRGGSAPAAPSATSTRRVNQRQRINNNARQQRVNQNRQRPQQQTRPNRDRVQ